MALSTLEGKRIVGRLWLPLEDVEPLARQQLWNIASLPWVKHLAVMPDCHFGKGATVGSVVAMRGAVAPAAVGVDIGCGMGAIRTSLTASDLPDSLKELREDIELRIPVGFASRKRDAVWNLKDDVLVTNILGHLERFSQLRAPQVAGLATRARLQLGTLGGGNHFIEVCLDTEQRVWLMLHSGSRNIGKELAEIHIAKARELIHNVGLPDRDLGVFLAGTPEMEAYRHDLYWAQQYAFLNRLVMFEDLKDVMSRRFPNVRFDQPILCHHNYVAEETHFDEQLFVTRKGAISAELDQLGIIPGSMGTRSFIVRGKGNPEALRSASHGAGRKMGRKQAERTFTLADLEAQTAGVECRKDAGVLDEIPGAYKDIGEVMQRQSDLVEIVAELKQVLCVKG